VITNKKPFGGFAGSHSEPIGLIDIVGIFLFLAGSYINTLEDYQRFAWKREIENKGRLYTKGLFKYSMHINYFGDSVSYV
jgi:steroid 5-alpha reductase family enzyme